MKLSNKAISKEKILWAIEEIIYKGGESNFVIFGLNSDYYIQIAAKRGDYEIYCEAVSDHYLEKELTNDQKSKLLNLSWNTPESTEGNFHLTHKVYSESTREQLANLIFITAKDVYKCDTIDSNDINLVLE